MEIDCKIDFSGYNKVLKDLNTMDSLQVEWGYPDDTRHNEHPNVTVAQIAYWNEMGVKEKGGGDWRMPPREFMSLSSIMVGSDMKRLSDQVMLALGKGEFSIKQSLNYVAKEAGDSVREAIDTQNFLPLEQSTITQKGHDTILIDSGQMYDEAKGVVVPFVVEDLS